MSATISLRESIKIWRGRLDDDVGQMLYNFGACSVCVCVCIKTLPLALSLKLFDKLREAEMPSRRDLRQQNPSGGRPENSGGGLQRDRQKDEQLAA